MALQHVGPPVQDKPSLGDAEGDVPDRGAEVRIVAAFVAGERVEPQHYVVAPAPGVGSPQFGERRAVGDEPRGHARVAERVAVDRFTVDRGTEAVDLDFPRGLCGCHGFALCCRGLQSKGDRDAPSRHSVQDANECHPSLLPSFCHCNRTAVHRQPCPPRQPLPGRSDPSDPCPEPAIMGVMDPLDVLTPLTTVAHNSLRREVMRRVLHAIFAGRLPAGTRLLVAKVARRLGTSSTPVREALLELDSVGAVEAVHNRGAVVAAFGAEQLRQIYHVRRILETEATRCACPQLDPAAVARLHEETRALVLEADMAGWLERSLGVDLRFHQLIAGHCGNARLSRELHRYDLLAEILRQIIGNDCAAQRQAMGEHLEILDALVHGRADESAAAMARHIESAAQTAEMVMFGARGGASTVTEGRSA